MANDNRPRGFKPYGRIWRVGTYQSGGEIFAGDAVKFDADGEVVAGTVAGALCGVAAHYVAAQGSAIAVYDSPEQEFVGQMDETEVNAQTDINLNYDFVAGTGSATYLRSAHEFDSSSQATTATLPFKCLRILDTSRNALGEFVDMVCSINNHQRGSHTGTAGV